MTQCFGADPRQAPNSKSGKRKTSIHLHTPVNTIEMINIPALFRECRQALDLAHRESILSR